MPYDKQGRLVFPSEIMKEFEPWMLDAMLEVGKLGGTKNEILLATGLTKRLFNAFLTPGGASYNPDFEDAFQMALMSSQAYWEQLGRSASAGLLEKHKSGTFQFMMKNNFRNDYKDEQIHKHDVMDVPGIESDLDPVEASKRYKTMLLESSLGDFFDV